MKKKMKKKKEKKKKRILAFFFFFFFSFFFLLVFLIYFLFCFDVQGLMQCLCHAKQNEKCVVWVVGLRSRHVRVAYVKTNTVRIRRTSSTSE